MKAVLPQFVPRMSYKWDSIGIRLLGEERVSELRNSPQSNDQKLQQILDAWIVGLHVTLPQATLFDVLRSSAVGLDDVANDFNEVGRLHVVHSGLGHRHNG